MNARDTPHFGSCLAVDAVVWVIRWVEPLLANPVCNCNCEICVLFRICVVWSWVRPGGHSTWIQAVVESHQMLSFDDCLHTAWKMELVRILAASKSLFQLPKPSAQLSHKIKRTMSKCVFQLNSTSFSFINIKKMINEGIHKTYN